MENITELPSIMFLLYLLVKKLNFEKGLTKGPNFIANPPELPTGKPHQSSLKVSKESRSSRMRHRLNHLPPPITTTMIRHVIQRLTGKPPDNKQPAKAGEVSPAERLASIQRTSPKKKQRFSWNRDHDMMQMLDEGVQMGQVPGILLSDSSTLPPISSENFSLVSLPSTPLYTFSPETFSPTTSYIFSPEKNMLLVPSNIDRKGTIPTMQSEVYPGCHGFLLRSATAADAVGVLHAGDYAPGVFIAYITTDDV
ncbi:hypothetical protein MTR_3g095820 [Medicago truncatula]|uniref:Uncharacterized protein n=1 Tax=Medicago truncatula TaxID=3880 RepID=G7JB03_MEDTR|nr:hypothetical protein MTR_3g095820 [Medicago truncatula]